MKRAQQILWAMTELGDDVVDMAEELHFEKPLWKQLLPIAACLVLLTGIVMQIHHFHPIAQEAATPPPQSKPMVDMQPEMPQQTEPVVPGETAQLWTPEIPACYTLPLENGGYVAVDRDGNILLQVENGTLSLLTDEATGEALAICHTVHPENPAVGVCTITFYDLAGKRLEQIEAWSVAVLGDVVVVNHSYSKFSLYRRSDRSLLQTGIIYSWISGDTVVTGFYSGSVAAAFWDQNGNQIAALNWNTHIGDGRVWNGRAFYQVYALYQDENNNWKTTNYGIVDGHGNFLTEQIYDRAEVLTNGFAACVSEKETQLLDLDTGEWVAALPYGCGTVIGAYDSLLFVSLDENIRTVNQVFSWDGTKITDAVEQVTVIDEEGDGVAELLQVSDGETVTYLFPDGTLLRMLPAGTQAISARTAIQISNGVALIDLQTGAEIPVPPKGYTAAVPYWPIGEENDFSTGLCFASYVDEHGVSHTDILREDGTLLLEDYADEPSMRGYAWEQSGVFRVAGGYRYLDGSWLYQELCGLPTVEE